MAQSYHEEPDRVRANTAPEINRRIDAQIERSVRRYAAMQRDDVSRRIRELEHEVDIERVLEALASSLSLTGVVLGATAGRRWFALPIVVLSFLLFHSLQGWCPPVALLRRLGVRTRQEIDRERYALKALIGDFSGITKNEKVADQVLAAVR